MKISYEADFDYATDGINVTFPDIPHAFTCGFTKRQAKKMAKEVLSLVWHGSKLTDLPPATKRTDKTCLADHSVEKKHVRMKVRDGVLIGKNVTEFPSETAAPKSFDEV